MAGKKFAKGSEEFVMFMDYWKLCQEFWEPESNDKYWEELCQSTDAFCEKYRNTGLSRELGLAIVTYIEKKSKDSTKRTGGFE